MGGIRVKKGKRAGQKFSAILHVVQLSEQYRSLSGNSVKILLELVRRHNSRNNGQIFAPIADISQITGVSINTVQRCINSLIKHNFIEITERGHLGIDGKAKANRYRLTFVKDTLPNAKPVSFDFTKKIPRI